MSRIAAQGPVHYDLALKILAWSTFASRALSLKELQHALATDTQTGEFDEEMILEGSSMVSLCAGLITIEKVTQTVSLVHYTTKKYLEDRAHLYFPNFHGTITHCCAVYLTMPRLRNLAATRMAQEFPLVEYACQFIGQHARLGPEAALQPQVLEALLQLLADPEKRKPFLRLHQRFQTIPSKVILPIEQETSAAVESDNNDSSVDIPMSTSYNTKVESHSGCSTATTDMMVEVTALHLAASMGLTRVASMLLRNECDVNVTDQTGKTALNVAMDRGFEKASEFLVAKGARINICEEGGQKVLLGVAERDWKDLGSEICRNCVRLNQESISAQLLSAVYAGNHFEVKEVTTRSAMDFKGKDRQLGENALFIATEIGAILVVQLLLSMGVRINSTDGAGRSSLHRATKRGHTALMQYFLAEGAVVDCRDAKGRTPWSENVHSRNRSISKVLIQAAADPNTTGPNGVSELYSAAAGGNTELVRFMLGEGTNPSIKTDFDWVPLHWAAYCGHVECVRLLINAGANLNSVSDQGVTPLDLAHQSGQEKVIEQLLAAGAVRKAELDEQFTGSTVVAAPESVEDISAGGAHGVLDNVAVRLLTLNFDQPMGQSTTFGQFVYLAQTSEKETILPFQISHPLNSRVQKIKVGRAQKRAEMGDYPLSSERFDTATHLCDVERNDFEKSAMKIKFRAAKLSSSVIMSQAWDGSWTIRSESSNVDSVLLFRTRWIYAETKEKCGSEWSKSNGEIVGQSFGHGEHSLSFDKFLDLDVLDTLVACWIAKTWWETLDGGRML